MGRMFDPQSSFWRGIGLVPDVLILSLMWLVFSLPVSDVAGLVKEHETQEAKD